jgi:hypothetical protein
VRCGIEYIRASSQDDISDREKLERLIAEREQVLTQYFIDRQLPEFDNRRYLMYALISIGIEMWKYLFNVKRGSPCDLLNRMTDYSTGAFADLVRAFEVENQDVRKRELRFFYQYIAETFENYTPDESKGLIEYIRPSGTPELYITSKFISGYNKYARVRDYPTCQYLTKVAELLNEVVDETIRAENRYIGTVKSGEYCIPFPINAIFPDEMPIGTPQLWEYDPSRHEMTVNEMYVHVEDYIKKLEQGDPRFWSVKDLTLGLSFKEEQITSILTLMKSKNLLLENDEKYHTNEMK